MSIDSPIPVEQPEQKRSPGRPATKSLYAEPSLGIKKGKASWKPASLNEFNDKEDGFRYRMSRKDANNLAKKAKEGWETVSKLQGSTPTHIEPGRINDGKSLTSAVEGSDWVLQRIPEDLAKERDAYYNNEQARRTAGLTAHLKGEMRDRGGNAPVHGEISISTKKGTQVID